MDSPAATVEPVPSISLIKMPRQQAIVWVLFLFSGICGLIYEVLWCRHLGLLFGNTVQSMSAVLTAFMGGLALGSYVGGRVCHRLKRPMMVYGYLELAIGIYCAFLPWAFSADSPIVPFYRRLYGETGGGTGLSIARFSISFVLLLIPTTFMGATLPVLSQYLVRSRAFLGKTVGALYAVNTFGAVLGAALTGFILLPFLGKANSNHLAVAMNIILGTLAVLFGNNATVHSASDDPNTNSHSDSATDSDPPASQDNGQPPISPLALKLAIFTFGLTGFAALTTQIGWNHALSLAMGSSSYVFSLIVSVFILGLSFGGVWGSRVAEKTKDPLALLGKVLITIGLGSIALTVVLGIGPKLNLPLAVWGKEWGWNWQLMLQASGIGLLIIGPTFLMGATMPLTMQVAAKSDGAPGRTVGTIYAVNTVGSILGSFIGGLVILPLLEIRDTLLLMAMFYTVPGVVLYLLSQSGREQKPRSEFMIVLLAAVATVIALFASPKWDPLTMSSGMFLLRDPHSLKAVKEGNWSEVFPDLHKDTELKYYSEGATATVAVTRFKEYLVAPVDVMDEPSSFAIQPIKAETPSPIDAANPVAPPSRSVFSLTVGGKPDASSHGDMTTQMGLTLVPVLLHPKPEEVLVIGLGSGASAGAALTPDTVKNVDVVEMSPEVVEASYFFEPYTGGLKYKPIPGRPGFFWLDTPRLTLIVNDGRNHLLLTSKKYDVIASEPSNPWLAGIGNLFTKEAFQLSHDHLNPGGVMCQWIHSYSLEETDFFSIVKTFGDVFKHMELWCVNRRDFLLIGTDSPIRMQISDLKARMEQTNVKPLLELIHFDSEEEFLSCFMSTDSELRNITQNAPLHTDDNMRLEFSAPKALYNTIQLMRSTQYEPDPESIVDLTKLPADARRDMESRLDSSASGREHTRCAFEHAGNRIDQWSKAQTLAPKQFWTVEYAKFIEAALHKRPLEVVPTRVSDPLAGVRKIAKLEGVPKALEALKKLNAGGANAIPCAELAVALLRAAGETQAAQRTVLETLRQPGMSDDPQSARLWLAAAELALEAENPNIESAVKIARTADILERKKGSVLDAVGQTWLKAKHYAEAYNEYRDLCSTNPKIDAFKIGLADSLIGCSSYPKLRSERTEVALRKLRFARRASREAAAFLPNDPAAWLRLAQANWELAKVDTTAAEYHKGEARAAWAKVVAADTSHAGAIQKIKPGDKLSAFASMQIEETFRMNTDAFMQLRDEIAKP